MSEKNKINEQLIVKLEEKVEILQNMIDILEKRNKYLETELLYAIKIDDWSKVKIKKSLE